MSKRPDHSVRIAVALTVLAGAMTAARADPFPQAPVAAAGVNVAVYASGFHDPRGLAFDDRGNLYVAEAGTTIGAFVPPPPPAPNEPPTRTRCEVYWPVGPLTGGHSGRISRVARSGAVSTVADLLPSAASNRLIGGDRQGVAAVAFQGQRLYAMVPGGGCSRGHPGEPAGVYRIYSNGAFQPIVDLGNVLRTSPDSKDPAANDFEPDGTWFNLVRAFGAFYGTEPNHGVLLRIDDDGSVSRVADLMGAIRAQDGDGDYTYSALTRHGGAFYVGTLGRIDTGFAGAVYRVSRTGAEVTRVATGLRGVLGVAFDTRGRMLVLQTTAPGDPPLADPTAGKLVRIESDGSQTMLISKLAFPTALIAGEDGAFYISNCGYHCDDQATGASLGVGQVLRVTIAGSRAAGEDGADDDRDGHGDDGHDNDRGGRGHD